MRAIYRGTCGLMKRPVKSILMYRGVFNQGREWTSLRDWGKWHPIGRWSEGSILFTLPGYNDNFHILLAYSLGWKYRLYKYDPWSRFGNVRAVFC